MDKKFTPFIVFVIIELFAYVFLGTNIIHMNLKNYMFENFSIWVNLSWIMLLILATFALWPRNKH